MTTRTMRFSIHHVGARFGNSALHVPDQFKPSTDIVMYDADSDCIEELVGGTPENVHTVSACLGELDGICDFMITANPSGSSLLEPSTAQIGQTLPMSGLDWDIGACRQIVETRQLNTQRLDTLLKDRGDLAAPDFLSLDTQGSELPIIKGAIDTLTRGDIVGLIVEVQFVELYKNVDRFGDVALWLEENGFHFAGFASIINAHASPQPIGQRASGFPVAGDATFLSRTDRFDQLEAAQRDIQLAKLAFASLCTGHLAHCFAALDTGENLPRSDENCAWLDLLHELDHARSNSPSLSPPRFPDILPENAMRAFSSAANPAEWPHIMDVTDWRASCGIPKVKLDEVLNDFLSNEDSPIEAVLRRAEFLALADNVKLMRRDHANKLKRFLDQSQTRLGQAL